MVIVVPYLVEEETLSITIRRKNDRLPFDVLVEMLRGFLQNAKKPFRDKLSIFVVISELDAVHL